MAKRWKTIVIVLIIFLVAIMLSFIWQDKQLAREKETQYEVMEGELRPLDLKKHKLNQELGDLNKQFEKNSQGIANLTLAFTDLSEIIYTDIFPQMNTYGFVGVLVLSEENFPGVTGCLSREQFKELIDAGWKCILRWDNQAELEEWLVFCRKLVREIGIVSPKVVYCAEGDYSREMDNFLIKNNFRVVIHHGEEDLPVILSESGKNIWHPGAMAWNQNGAVTRLSDAISQRGNLIFTIGSDSDLEQYAKEEYAGMLGKIHTYCEAGELMVTDPLSALEYRRELEANQESLKKEYEEKASELKEQLEALDIEIDEITEKYIRN